MKSAVLFLILAMPFHLVIADEEHPEVVAFARKLKGIEWSLRGTFGLKGLEFDGKDVREVKAGGVKGGVYESAFVDTGVLRLNFRGANTGWYFFSDDLRFVTPLTVSGEVAFKLPIGPQAKAVREFPKDITGVVFESEPDEGSSSPRRCAGPARTSNWRSKTRINLGSWTNSRPSAPTVASLKWSKTGSSSGSPSRRMGKRLGCCSLRTSSAVSLRAR